MNHEMQANLNGYFECYMTRQARVMARFARFYRLEITDAIGIAGARYRRRHWAPIGS